MKKSNKIKGGFLPKCSNQHIDISNHHTIRNYLDYYPAMVGGNIHNHNLNPAHPGIGNHIINNSDPINITNYARVNGVDSNNILAKIVSGGSRSRNKKRKKRKSKRRTK